MGKGKTEILRVRLTPSESRYVEKRAAALGISMSDYVRRRLFETAPRLNDLEDGDEVSVPSPAEAVRP